MVMHLIIQNIPKGKFSEYEKYAKNLSLGLWQMKFEYPWIWRKKNR